MNIDFFDFVAHGQFGRWRPGTFWHEVPALLGPAPLYEPPKSTPGLARYGSLEFAIRESKLQLISLDLSGPEVQLPPALNMTSFGDPELHLDQARELLKARDISWDRVDLLCDDWIEAWRTEAGVHLTFGGELLAKVGAANPETLWGD